MWGVIPSFETRSRLQLSSSDALSPADAQAFESLVERMLRGGVTRLCFVVGPAQTRLIQHFGGSIGFAHICYTVQPSTAGPCDALFRALPLIDPDEDVVFAVPNGIWFPEDAVAALPRGVLSLLLFSASQLRGRSGVTVDDLGYVREIASDGAASHRWGWGALRAPARVLREMHILWLRRVRRDREIEPLVNEFVRRGGRAKGVRAGQSYHCLDTAADQRDLIRLVAASQQEEVADANLFFEGERAGVWSLGKAQPLPSPDNAPPPPSAA